MFIDFSISNFRSIRDTQTISFEATTDDSHLEDYFVINKGKYRLLKIATIMGANASGKSNVLRAFNMFPVLILHPCKDKSDIISYDKFALDAACSTESSKMIVNFIVKDIKYYYEVSFDNNVIYNEVLKAQPFEAFKEHTIYVRETDKQSLFSTLKWGEKYRSVSNTRALTPNLLHNRTVFGAYQNSNVDIPWMKEIINWAKSYIMPIVKTQEQNLCEYVSKRIINNTISKSDVEHQLIKADIGISGLDIEKKEKPLPPELVNLILHDDKIPSEVKTRIQQNPITTDVVVTLLHKGKQGQVPLDFEQESNGTQRYYELSGILFKLIKQSHFVTIDELECRLHPDLYQHFIVTYLKNSKESQLAFTTHMREFLADKDMFRDDSVWFTEKSEIGATELYSLADFDTDTLRSNASRYNAYRAGRLGGIPHLGDTYISIDK